MLTEWNSSGGKGTATVSCNMCCAQQQACAFCSNLANEAARRQHSLSFCTAANKVHVKRVVLCTQAARTCAVCDLGSKCWPMVELAGNAACMHEPYGQLANARLR